MARMQARYRGTCYVCGESIRAGETIDYDRSQGGARHDACTPYDPPEDAIYISVGEGYGGSVFQVGDIVRNPHHDHPLEEVILQGMPTETQERQRRDEEPAFLYVLHGTKQYYREDGMSFGVGDESGYVYGAYCRPATDEESAPLRAAIAKVAAEKKAQRQLWTLRDRVTLEGAYPNPAELEPGGRYLLDTRTIYGGGDEWYVAPGVVWHIAGNGGDGDDWSRNNLGGAIAVRLADPDGQMAAELDRLAAILAPEE